MGRETHHSPVSPPKIPPAYGESTSVSRPSPKMSVCHPNGLTMLLEQKIQRLSHVIHWNSRFSDIDVPRQLAFSRVA